MAGEAGGDDDGDPDPKRDVMANDVLVPVFCFSSTAVKHGFQASSSSKAGQPVGHHLHGEGGQARHGVVVRSRGWLGDWDRDGVAIKLFMGLLPVRHLSSTIVKQDFLALFFIPGQPVGITTNMVEEVKLIMVGEYVGGMEVLAGLFLGLRGAEGTWVVGQTVQYQRGGVTGAGWRGLEQ